MHITILGLNHWELVEKHMSAMEVAEKLLDSVPEEADEVETALYLYQWLTDHVRYDSYDYYDNEGWNLLYDTLVERKTVCSGYTEALYYLRSYTVPLIIAAIGATPLPKRIKAKLEATRVGGAITAIAEPVALAALLCLCTAYLIDGSFNPFLYFRF